MASCSSVLITDIHIHDIRFPTSQTFSGSDAMHTAPDYSCVYVILETSMPGLHGYGLTFTLGRGNEICAAAAEALSSHITGNTLDSIWADMGQFWHQLINDGQLRWLGPEKGVIHLAAAALVNALWDLKARQENKPVWQLVYDMSPEEIIRCIDFSYIRDLLSPAAALDLLESRRANREQRLQQLQSSGIPAYTTSPGWLGYSDPKLRELCEQAVNDGWRHIKLKVGQSLEDDMRRCRIARDALGNNVKLMLDANQIWNVDQAIEWMDALAEFNPWWIEEPTSPDDILGHCRIRSAIHPVKVATGEQCQNRVMFKQFLQSGAMDICQIDSCRLGGVNEVLAVLLLAAFHNIPVCPHAGGVGLCEYVQHLAAIDFLCIGGQQNQIVEYVDHLHEHFVDPVRIKNAHYLLPKLPGYSAQLHDKSILDYSWPDGHSWSHN
ncbi:enolase C-terminal domain-like protein [Endozoicomonadaceae bacterium StTr2]